MMQRARVGCGLTLSGIAMLAGCGSTGSKRAPRGQGSYAMCATARPSDACVRFLDGVAGVHTIRLTTSVPSQVAKTCADAARKTRLRVICPPVVPMGGVVNDPGLYGAQIVTEGSYSMSINNGQNPGRVHWEVGAIRGAAHALWIFDRANWDAAPPKRPVRMIGKRRYLGYVVTLYRFPDSDGQLEGHDAAFATKSGVTYFVSIHGHNHDDGDIAMLLATLARSP